MQSTYKAYRNAIALNQTTFTGAFKWFFIYFIFNAYTSVKILSSGMINTVIIALIACGYSILYTNYNANVNTPQISSTLPLTNKRRVVYIYWQIFLTMVVTLLVVGGLEIVYFLYAVGLEELLTKFTVGKFAAVVMTVTVIFVFAPLTFVRKRKTWYISAFIILAVYAAFCTLICNLAEDKNKIVYRTILGASFENIPHYGLVFAGICVAGLILIGASFAVSVKLAGKRDI
jgi:hypothetical protein